MATPTSDSMDSMEKGEALDSQTSTPARALTRDGSIISRVRSSFTLFGSEPSSPKSSSFPQSSAASPTIPEKKKVFRSKVEVQKRKMQPLGH